MQQNYQKLARLYDLLMAAIDYDEWVDYVIQLVERMGGNFRAVADLACGTGGSTLPWARRGYQTYGVDLSGAMLAIARKKAEQAGLVINFLEEDLCKFELPQPVELAVVFQDGINYITDPEALRDAFRAIHTNLKKGGFFVFDLNFVPLVVADDGKPYRISQNGFTLSWQSGLIAEDLWEIQVEGEFEDDPEPLRERHRERIYRVDEVCSWLVEIGCTVDAVYRSFTFYPPDNSSPRVVVVSHKL